MSITFLSIFYERMHLYLMMYYVLSIEWNVHLLYSFVHNGICTLYTIYYYYIFIITSKIHLPNVRRNATVFSNEKDYKWKMNYIHPRVIKEGHNEMKNASFSFTKNESLSTYPCLTELLFVIFFLIVKLPVPFVKGLSGNLISNFCPSISVPWGYKKMCDTQRHDTEKPLKW